MSQSSYNAQLLAIWAAAFIDGAATTGTFLPTPITYGCSVTKNATGVYKLILPTGEGLIDAQSFTSVQPKANPTALPLIACVSDESEFIKTIVTFSAVNSGTTPTDANIEVVIRRSTINPF